MVDIDKHGNITFSSGRYMSPNAGIVGLSHDGSVGEGYDQIAAIGGDSEDLTTEDLRELADLMIERWQRYKRTAGGGK